MNLNQINKLLNEQTSGQLKLNKGKGYFYFTSNKGKLPESIMTKSVKNIRSYDIAMSAKYFNEENI